MSRISNEAIDGISQDLEQEITRSWRNAGANHRWNVFFRVALLLIGISIVVCSAIASSDDVAGGAQEYWSVASAILGGASTALAAFAFNQFNFESRQRIWLDRLSALKVVRDRLLIGDRDQALLDDLATVRSWHDFNPPAAETFSRLLRSRPGDGDAGDNRRAETAGDDGGSPVGRPAGKAAARAAGAGASPEPIAPAKPAPARPL